MSSGHLWDWILCVGVCHLVAVCGTWIFSSWHLDVTWRLVLLVAVRGAWNIQYLAFGCHMMSWCYSSIIYSIFIFKDHVVQDESPFFLACLILEDNGFMFVWTAHPTTQYYIPQDMNSLYHYFEIMKMCMVKSCIKCKKNLGINWAIYDFSSTLLFTGRFCGPHCTTIIGKGL